MGKAIPRGCGNDKLARAGVLVPAVSRAFEILDVLSRTAQGLTKMELAKRLRIPYSTTFNLLATMEHHGYVLKDGASNRYRLGFRLFSYADAQARDVGLRQAASPILDELVRETGLTVHLGIFDRGDAIYIDRREAPGFIRINTWIGKRNYVHTSALGKALLTHRSKEEIAAIWKSGLPRRTAKTVTSLAKLLKMLKDIRACGYALDDEEDEVGGRCVAAPVCNASREVEGAISASGHSSNFRREDFPILGEIVRRYAAKISERLGYRPDPVLAGAASVHNAK
jgi:DNA-binding IclR family transcriptional regulator